MLRFLAPLALDFDAAFVKHGPLRWIARDTSKLWAQIEYAY